jgi:hypothetical protein
MASMTATAATDLSSEFQEWKSVSMVAEVLELADEQTPEVNHLLSNLLATSAALTIANGQLAYTQRTTEQNHRTHKGTVVSSCQHAQRS